MLRAFHSGMLARVALCGELSESFNVSVGVKQRYVLSPVIFNRFMFAFTFAFRDGVSADDGVAMTCRLDGKFSTFAACAQ